MALEDVKDSAKEFLQSIWGRAKESSAWIQLSEKLQNQTPLVRNFIFAGAIFVAILLLSIFPWIFFSSSQNLEAEYETKYELIRELVRVSRAASSLPPPPQHMSANDLAGVARSALESAKLAPEQITAITPLESASAPGIAKTIEQAVIQVSLIKLNITQIIDTGYALMNIHPLARMLSTEINATKDNSHLFDVSYKIAAFSAKQEINIKSPSGSGGGSASGKKPGKADSKAAKLGNQLDGL